MVKIVVSNSRADFCARHLKGAKIKSKNPFHAIKRLRDFHGKNVCGESFKDSLINMQIYSISSSSKDVWECTIYAKQHLKILIGGRKIL